MAAVPEGVLPMSEHAFEEWSYGDLETGFQDAALVLDETFVTAGNSHHSMEPRSNMAYWENGRCHVFGSGQSQSFNMPVLARLIDEPVENIHYVGEFCGGGFGSKGRSYPVMAIPPLMSKKINRPVMMRISREEEYYLGIARGGLQGRARLGFREDGRIIAADIYLVQDTGPTPGFWDYRAAAFRRNMGLRIDLILASDAMSSRCTACTIDIEPRKLERPSDHTPVFAEFRDD